MVDAGPVWVPVWPPRRTPCALLTLAPQIDNRGFVAKMPQRKAISVIPLLHEKRNPVRTEHLERILLDVAKAGPRLWARLRSVHRKCLFTVQAEPVLKFPARLMEL